MLTHCHLLHSQHCSCFRDVVIGQILGLHCTEVSYYDCCHQMTDFKAKVHQNRFRLWLRPKPLWGAYSAPPGPLAGYKGPTSKGRQGREWENEIAWSRLSKVSAQTRQTDRQTRTDETESSTTPNTWVVELDANCVTCTTKEHWTACANFPNVVAQRYSFGSAHPGGYDPKIAVGRDFCTMHLPPSLAIPCLLVRKLLCWQTNKQTDAAENIQRSSLRYDVR